jgi:PIN domain nuclease of toxin-antitoxin system
VNYLLDTHALLWIADDDPRLSERAESLFLDNRNAIYLSVASLWEIAIKVSIGKLSIDEPLDVFIQKHITSNGINFKLIEPKHILPLTSLPFHHKDPFDRLIISQAMMEEMPIISNDSLFDLYPIERVW